MQRSEGFSMLGLLLFLFVVALLIMVTSHDGTIPRKYTCECTPHFYTESTSPPSPCERCGNELVEMNDAW